MTGSAGSGNSGLPVLGPAPVMAGNPLPIIAGQPAPGTVTGAGPAVWGLGMIVAECMNLNGGKPNAAAKAASVIYAESSGKTNARCYNVRNPRTGRVECYPGGHPPAGVRVLSVDRGICQWNSAAHPEISDKDADNPHKAIKHMYDVTQHFTTFGPWSPQTYGTARQRKFEKLALDLAYGIALPPGSGDPSPWEAAAAAPGNEAEKAAKKAKEGLVALPKFLGMLSNPHTWVRVLEVVLGAAAIVLGAFLLNKSLLSQALGSVVTSTVGGVASKVGAAAVV